MKRNKIAPSHAAKTKYERDEYINFVQRSGEDHTIPHVEDGTLRDDNNEYSEMSPKNIGPKRKNIQNRFLIHIKEYWPNYLMGGIGTAALFFFVTFNIKIAEINKDVSYIYEKLNENTRRIEKVSDDVFSLKDDLSTFGAELKSLNDRFHMFIELFSENRNRTP
jgi:hypothetical protein